MMREWYSAAELAALRLPGMPSDASNVRKLAAREGWERQEWLGDRWRPRQGRGGGAEYHYSLLPPEARAALVTQEAARTARTEANTARRAVEDAALQLRVDALWEAFDRLPAARKKEAEQRLAALNMLVARTRAGASRTLALIETAAEHAISVQTLRNWEALTFGLPRPTWLAALAPSHGGGAQSAACSPEAWEWIKGDYLRPAKPGFSSCYRRLVKQAERQGWTIPSEKTLWRRMQADVAHTTKVREREGRDALERLLPSQRRDRSVYAALEAVNCDAHTFDVFVLWPGRDKPVRPVLYGVQDVYSGMLLGYRLDLSENTQTIRLALLDVAERWGVPSIYWFDNTLAAANKQITGRAAHRFRFKIREEDPAGLIDRLGGTVHFTTTYHGQAKPVERAFRDIAQDWAKDPRFHGAYSGNNPMAKPSDYGSRAIPLEQFRAVLAELCEEHNARPGRRSLVAAGRSLRETFEAGYRERAQGEKPIPRLTEAQRRMFLLQAEVRSIRREQPMLHLYDGRYFAEWMLQMPGARVIVRFDPDELNAGVEVYSLDERYLGDAERLEDVGFNSTAEARAWTQWKRSMRKSAAERAELEKGRSVREIAAALDGAPKPEPATAPPVRVVRPVFGNTALKPREQEEERTEAEVLMLRAMRLQHANRK